MTDSMQQPPTELLNFISDIIILVNNKGQILWVNGSVTEILGYQPEELYGKSIECLMPARYQEKHVRIRDSYISRPNRRRMNDGAGLWAISKSKDEIPVSIELNYYEESGQIYTVCTLRTLTEKELFATALEKMRERLKQSQTLANVGTWDWDISNGILVWTDQVYHIFGLEPQQFPASYEGFLSFIHPDDRQAVTDAVNDSIEENAPYYIKHRIIQPSGEIKHVIEKGQVIRDENNQPTRMIGTILDITQLNENEEKLRRLAHYDDLTQLPNRALCRQELEVRIAHAQFFKNTFAIFYIDIDNFKNINDTQGHVVGDEFLYEVAQLLSSNLPSEMFLARLGGDEFIIISDSVTFDDTLEEKIQAFSEQLISLLDIRKTYTNCSIDISASIGVAIFPKHGNNFTELFSAADIAMYQVKERNKNHYEIYNPKIEQQRLKQFKLISDMRAGLTNNQFVVHYQAKQNLHTEQLEGCEALVRWNHPELGPISPFEFIPLAESSGLIIPLGKLVLEQACMFVQKWQVKSESPIKVSVNVSAGQLKSASFVGDVKQAIQQAGINSNQIELEMTESFLMDDIEETNQVLFQLKDIGVAISIDDFGTGYSCLSYLNRLPVDTLKIDKSFVDGLPSKESSVSIVISILALAASLQLDTVAEGVENEEQKYFLKTMGCDTLQGYLYCKPIPESEFLERFL